VKKSVNARIVSNRRIAPDHFVMEVKSVWLSRNSSPGQFVAVRARENATDPLLRIPLGVHAIRKKGIRLLYKVVGSGTKLLMSKRKGERINILGPLGNGFDLTPVFREKDSRAVIVAGGHGIAPLYELARVVTRGKKKVDFFIGAGTKKHVVCSKELRKLGAKVHVATEDGSMGHKGYVTDLLKKHLKQVKRYGTRVQGYRSRATIYACGPRPMLAALAKNAKRSGVPAQVSLDAYMACGIGACLGCVVRTVDGYRRVCKDGPVFDAREIVWESA